MLNEVAGFLSSMGSHSLALIFYLIARHTALVLNRSVPIILFEELYLTTSALYQIINVDPIIPQKLWKEQQRYLKACFAIMPSSLKLYLLGFIVVGSPMECHRISDGGSQVSCRHT